MLEYAVACLGVLSAVRALKWEDVSLANEDESQTYAMWSDKLSTIPPIDPKEVEKVKDRMIEESHAREKVAKYYNSDTMYIDPLGEYAREGVERITDDPVTRKPVVWTMGLLDTEDELYDVVRYNSMVEDYKGKKHLGEKPHQTPSPVKKVFEDPFIDGIHSRGHCPVEFKGMPEVNGEKTLVEIYRYGKMIGIMNVSTILAAQRVAKWAPEQQSRSIIGEVRHWFDAFEWTRKAREHQARLAPGEANITVVEYVPQQLMEEAKRVGLHYRHGVVYSRHGVLHIVPHGGGRVWKVTNARELQQLVDDKFLDKEFENKTVIVKWTTQPPAAHSPAHA